MRERRHRVEQVGDHADARPAGGGELGRRALAVSRPRRRRRRPRATRSDRTRRRTPGRASPLPRRGSRPTHRSRRVPGNPIQRGSWAPGRFGEIAGPFEVEPERRRRRLARRPAIAANESSAAHRAASGAVTIVGRKAVTPVLGEPARHLADRLRIGGEVVTPSAVELQIDEPGRDVHAGDVDRLDRRSLGGRASRAMIVPSATVTVECLR